jgi:1,4-dihydroxy-2-naphthoate octaprenyltransferase
MDDFGATRPGGDLDLATSDQVAINGILDGGDRLVIASSVSGNPSATPLHYVRDGIDLIFFCSPSARIAAQIAINPAVQAVVWSCDPKAGTAVEVSGCCTKSRDPALRQRAAARLSARSEAFARLSEAPSASPDTLACFRLRPTRLALVNPLAIPRFAWHEFPQHQPSDAAQALHALGGWMRLWIGAVRAPFFTAAIVPVLLAATIARHAMLRAPRDGTWSWLMFAWVLCGAVLAAAGTNLINDYGDHGSGADDRNQAAPNPFTGGSRTIQLGLLAPWKVLAGSAACFAAVVAIGLHINALIAGSPFAVTPLLAIGVIGCALGITYSVGPFRLSYRGGGEVAVAIGFGPVIVLGASYALTAASGTPWPWLASLLASLPVATFIALILWINQFQDAPADAASDKRNWVVRTAAGDAMTFRFERPFAIYRFLNLLSFGLVLLLGLLGCFARGVATPYLWLALLPFPAFVIAERRGRQWVARWQDPAEDRRRLPFALLPVNALTILVQISTGLLLALGYLLADWV